MKAEAIRASQEALEQSERVSSLVGAGQTQEEYEQMLVEFRAVARKEFSALELESQVDLLRTQKKTIMEQKNMLLKRASELGTVLEETNTALENVLGDLFESPSAREDSIKTGGENDQGEATEADEADIEGDYDEDADEYDDFEMPASLKSNKRGEALPVKEKAEEVTLAEEEEGGMFSAFMGTVLISHRISL